MTVALLSIAVFGYTLAIVLASVVTVYRSDAARRVASLLFGATWLVHSGALVSVIVYAGHVPPTNLAEFLLVLGWVVLTLHLYVWFRLRIDAAGLVLLLICALATFAAVQLFYRAGPRAAAHHSMWFVFHTVVSTIGLAVLCLAFAMSLMYLVQDRALKSRKTLRLLERLPSLEKCDRIGYQALLSGFLLLSLGICTGVLISVTDFGVIWLPGTKKTFSLLAWIVFASVLLSRAMLGIRGRKSAYLTIAGFAFGLLTVLGITL